ALFHTTVCGVRLLAVASLPPQEIVNKKKTPALPSGRCPQGGRPRNPPPTTPAALPACAIAAGICCSCALIALYVTCPTPPLHIEGDRLPICREINLLEGEFERVVLSSRCR